MRVLLRIVLLPICIALTASLAWAEKRVALVIGNSAYENVSPLSNPKNDARLMQAALSDVGFKVILAVDADFNDMRRAIRDFGRELRAAGDDAVGLFYYAGHGVQSRGRNYLIPLQARISDEADLSIEAISTANVLAQMDGAGNKLNLVILDSCRNNPYMGTVRSSSRGLARVDTASGTLVAFAAAPGQVAVDGEGENSPYTLALAQYIRQPSLSVEQVFKRVRNRVESATGGQQTPWEESSLRGDFYFVSKPARATVSQTSPSADAFELSFWEAVKNSQSASDYEEYLKAYPNGRFSGLAKARIGRFKMAAIVPTVQPSVPDVSSPRVTANLSLGAVTQFSVTIGAREDPLGRPTDFGRLGVRIWALAPDSLKFLKVDGRYRGGVIVEEVVKGSPAEGAGLKVGDVILEMGGIRMMRADGLVSVISGTKPETSVDLVIWRPAKGWPALVRSLRPKALSGEPGALLLLRGVLSSESASLQEQSQSLRALINLASRGSAEAMNALGLRYMYGDALEREPREAVKWYRKAALHGHLDAMYELGRAYEQGKGTGKSLKRAMVWFEKAAKRGHVYAMAMTGWLYEQGAGGEQNPEKACRWYQKAAKGSHFGAMYNLAKCFDNGSGLSKDNRSAFNWYLKAAQHGHLTAMYRTGLKYSYGTGVTKDKPEAARWLVAAADKGHAYARLEAGFFYDRGDGLRQDSGLAAKYLVLSMQEGNADITEWIVRNADKLRLETRKNLQTALKAAGLFKGTIDGRMSNTTKEALRAYAKTNRK